MEIIKKLKFIIEPILIIVITVALITLLYNFYVLLNENTETGNERQLTEGTLNNASFIRQNINSDLNTVLTMSKYVTTFDDINGEEAKEAIDKISKELPFSLVLITSLKGTYICSNDAVIDLSDPEYFAGATGDDREVTGIYKHALFGRDMVALTSPIYQNGRLVGNVSGLYYSDYIQNSLVNLGKDSFFQIIDKNGDYILFNDSPEYMEYKNIFTMLEKAKIADHKDFIDVMSDISKGKTGFIRFRLNNEDVYLSYAPVGVNDWYLLSFSKDEGLIMRPSDIKDSTMILAVKIIVLFLILVAYIIWRQFKYKTVLEQHNANLEILNKKLKFEAENDLMTGLFNRVTSENMITDFLESDGKKGRHALFVLDIDNFKRINDEIGHLSGDKVLVEASAGICQHFRTSDIKGRFGGDEFIILLKDIDSEEDLIKKANEILTVFHDIKLKENDQINILGSIGIAVYPDHGTNYHELFKKADIAMYHSKEAGKNGYSIYDKDLESNS